MFFPEKLANVAIIDKGMAGRLLHK